MNLLDLFVKFTIDADDYIRGAEEVQSKNKSLGDSTKQVGTASETAQNKMKVLEARYSAAKKQVSELSEALNKSVKETGAESKETQELAQQLKKAEKQADDLSKEISDLSEASDDAGGSVGSFADKIKTNFAGIAKAAAGIGAVITAVGKIGTALYEAAEETREYRTEMGKLETAFASSGHGAMAATQTYQELYSVLGETDRSVEASQQLAKLCNSEQQLQEWTTILIGAFAAFDDSLPIEGLAEAANETAKTGTLTGVLVDAINWAGASEEEFQKQLNACTTEQERQAVITQKLTSLYGKTAETYKKTNKDVIDATKAQESLTAATARLGAAAEPVVMVVKEGLAGAVNLLADALDYVLDPMDYAIEKMEGTAESSQEAAAKVADYEAQLAQLAEVPPILWSAEHDQQRAYLTAALEEAKMQYEELRLVEQGVAAPAEVFRSATEQYAADATALYEKFVETYEGIYDRVAGWFGPFEEAATSVKTNINDMMAAMQSQIDFNNAYSENLQALKEYGLGSLSEAFQSYGADGAAYAEAIVKAVEQAGGATTDEGQKIIQGFQEINQKVTESQGELTQTMALLSGEFESNLQSLNETYGAAIADLDKSKEANTAATNTFQAFHDGMNSKTPGMIKDAETAAKDTFQAFLNGMNSKIPGIMSTMESIGGQITSALQSGIGTVSIPVNIETKGEIPGHAKGLDFVPYDNYLAYLHKGEAVLTAEEAAAWRAGKEIGAGGNSESSGGNVTVNQYIDTVPQTPVEFASTTAAYFEQARWVM